MVTYSCNCICFGKINTFIFKRGFQPLNFLLKIKHDGREQYKKKEKKKSPD